MSSLQLNKKLENSSGVSDPSGNVNSADSATGVGFSRGHRRLLNVGCGALVVLFAVSFVAKPLINLAAAVSYLLTLITLFAYDRNLFRRESMLLYFLVPIGLGVVTSVFSVDGGWRGIGGFMNTFKFFFIPLALAVLLRDDKRIWWLLAAALGSALFATTYGFLQPEQRYLDSFHGILRVGRNADMLMVVVLACIVFLDDEVFRRRYPKHALAIALLVVMLSVGIFMSNIRGAWLGLALGVACYSFLFNRRWIIPLALLGFTVMILGADGSLVTEFASIANFETNASNNTRFQLWSSGIDFIQLQLWFGAGSESIDKLFTAFFSAQSVDYQQRYDLVPRYAGHFHNSFLQILAEWGLIFFIMLILGWVLLSIKLVRTLPIVPPDEAVFIRVFVVTSVGFLSSQFFHSNLYSYGATIYLLIVFCAIHVATKARLRDSR